MLIVKISNHIDVSNINIDIIQIKVEKKLKRSIRLINRSDFSLYNYLNFLNFLLIIIFII